MATKTSPSRRRAASRKSPARRKPAPKKPPKTPVRTVLSPWARDALGIGLVVFGLLAVLSMWFEAAGPAGDGIAWLLKAAFGIGAYAAPVVGVYWGIVLLRDLAREERVRMFIGFCVLGLGLLGLASLGNGNPSPLAPVATLQAAAGYVGAIVVYPMSNLISEIGAAIVCVGLAFLGFLVFSGTPVSTITGWVREFRASRGERDPVGVAAEQEEPAAARAPRPNWRTRRDAFLESMGLTEPDEDLVVLHEAVDEPVLDLADPGPPEPAPSASTASRRGGRTISTSSGPY
ncbi:MAG TPA: DNA translocase FtsK 4TM domain-containing protein, partial [Actinomycetota bacterium]